MKTRTRVVSANPLTIGDILITILCVGLILICVLPLRAASVMFATVPILVVYPWLQKYFITGATLGAVKE
jgi:ABC-type glycerol-3-phosphate transport system permease component